MNSKIDYSQYKCPKNPKHVLRKSSSPQYCDVWCDACVGGWTIKELASPEVSQTKEFIVYNHASRSDFHSLYLKVTKELKVKLLKAKAIVATLDPSVSISVPERETFSSSYAIEHDGFSFNNDEDDEYKYNIEDAVKATGVIALTSLKKPMNFKSMDYKILGTFSSQPIFIVASHRGFKLVHEDLDSSGNNQINTSFISWDKLN